MTRCFFSVRVLATLWLHVWAAAGALYPIKPVSTTIYEAGFPAEVKWMEDGKTPLLNLTGPLRIDLYGGRNTYLATIANETDPLSLSTTVFIPTNIPPNYHIYTLRFVASKPYQVIYTANFTIIPSPFKFSQPSMNSSFSTSSPPVKTVTSTIPSRIVGTSTSESIATPTNSASVGISWTWDFHTTAEPKGPYAVNAEKMRFCLMFVVWPALVGLSMSL